MGPRRDRGSEPPALCSPGLSRWLFQGKGARARQAAEDAAALLADLIDVAQARSDLKSAALLGSPFEHSDSVASAAVQTRAGAGPNLRLRGSDAAQLSKAFMFQRPFRFASMADAFLDMGPDTQREAHALALRERDRRPVTTGPRHGYRAGGKGLRLSPNETFGSGDLLCEVYAARASDDRWIGHVSLIKPGSRKRIDRFTIDGEHETFELLVAAARTTVESRLPAGNPDRPSISVQPFATRWRARVAVRAADLSAGGRQRAPWGRLPS
jgi:hypothetical protein